jgi:hypothetical protein
LTKVTIPPSVRSIKAGAFRGCKSLASVMIPESVRRIKEEAFLGCESLTGVTIPRACFVAERAFDECLRARIVRV